VKVEKSPRLRQGKFYPLSLDAHQSISQFDFNGRETIQMLICDERGFLVVLPTKGTRFILPQGEIKRKEERSIILALLREAYEELGMAEGQLNLRHGLVVHGEYLNPIPKERRKKYASHQNGRIVEHENKHCILVIVSVVGRSWVRLNEENQHAIWIDSLDGIKKYMQASKRQDGSHNGERRVPIKIRALKSGLKKACRLGFLRREKFEGLFV
jgi:8-oxo-dGTP pyrophosphatase MutT (NUDIX family)